MELATNIFLLLLGISILVWGANKFVDHASVIAKHMGISDLVIGLTLIAFGTSAPEIFVGISSIINQNEGRVGHTCHDNNPDLAGKAMHIVLSLKQFPVSIWNVFS